MNLIKKFKDDFENVAVVEKTMLYPYYGAKKRQEAYVLSLISLYDDSFVYHRSVYDNMADLMENLAMFSCNTWKEMKPE